MSGVAVVAVLSVKLYVLLGFIGGIGLSTLLVIMFEFLRAFSEYNAAEKTKK